MNELQAGDKIQYRLFDKKGKEHWFNGVIHGVRRYEERGFINRITYLIDTGRDERVDELPYDHRQREASKRVNVLVGKGADVYDAIEKVYAKGNDLPDRKIDIERVRQPEQIELPPEHIRAV